MTIGPRQFAAWRIAFGTYLALHFARLVPYGAELFSREGVLPDARANATHGLFPNVLAWSDSPAAVTALLVALVTLSILFAAGVARRACAALLWFGWACLFDRNNLIANPSIPYVGLLLVASCLVPPGEGLSIGRAAPSARWEFPRAVGAVVWILLFAGYAFSGWTKLRSPSWLDGSALRLVLENPLARPGLARDLALAMPEPALRVATWLALAVELGSLPLALWRRTRFVAWAATAAMHVAVLFVVSFADLSVGMLMTHAFAFDGAWLPRPVATRARRATLDPIAAVR